ncbi:MAG: TIGR04053 family radical SAM/SPASM domain-containing protein [Thermaerobacter sp.]|nr:TIGR04053 family radical SAM/SPASM domain-containing protein [Thermaerobacter sp.]
MPTSAEGHISPFGRRPMLVFWETTKACLLACRHCRATAQREPLPGELDTAEGEALLREIRAFDAPPPVVIFTGGDLLMRPDIDHLLRYARDLGLHTAAAPAATPLLTREALKRLADAGVHSISLSLDAPDETHDAIRGVSGTFQRTLEAAREALSVGLQVQVNTVVMRSTLETLPDIAALMLREGIPVWEVFYLIVTGRALLDDALSPKEQYGVAQFLLQASRYDLLVRTVEAPFLRRALLEEERGEEATPLAQRLTDRLGQLAGDPPHGVRIGRRGTLDGDGIIFVGYDGTVFPGGFLPVALGNVRTDSLSSVYREHSLLQAIRARALGGACGTCEYRAVCGGSRARAYAATGDALASDPACPYAAAD